MAVPIWVPGQILASADVGTWMRPLAGYKIGTTSQTSNTVRASDPDLTVSFPFGGAWVVEAMIRFNGPASDSLAFAFTYTGTVNGAFAVLFTNTSGGGTPDLRQHPWTFTGMTAITTGVANEQVLRIHGVAAPTAATAFTFAWAQGSSSATATSIDAGSYLKAWRAG